MRLRWLAGEQAGVEARLIAGGGAVAQMGQHLAAIEFDHLMLIGLGRVDEDVGDAALDQLLDALNVDLGIGAGGPCAIDLIEGDVALGVGDQAVAVLARRAGWRGACSWGRWRRCRWARAVCGHVVEAGVVDRIVGALVVYPCAGPEAADELNGFGKAGGALGVVAPAAATGHFDEGFAGANAEEDATGASRPRVAKASATMGGR